MIQHLIFKGEDPETAVKSDDEMMEDYERWVDTTKYTTNKKAIALYCESSVSSIEKLDMIKKFDKFLTEQRNKKIVIAKEAGLSQRKVATATGVSLGQVNKVLNDGSVQNSEVPKNEHPEETHQNPKFRKWR